MSCVIQLFDQALPELAVGENRDQLFTGTFLSDVSGNAFEYRVALVRGGNAVFTYTTAGGGITAVAADNGDGTWTVVLTVLFRSAQTDLLEETSYEFELWDTTANKRIAAGNQPVVEPIITL